MAQLKLNINNQEITQDVDKGYLNTDIASASGTLTLDSIVNFAINQVLVLGKIGQEKTEIIKTHAGTAPTGSTVTLASNTVYIHNRGEEVSIVKYDQYELSHATTVAGSKTALTTTLGSGLIPIDVTRDETLYYDAEYTSGYYFVRKKNSIDATFSGYSDPIPYTGVEKNSVAGIIESALTTSGEKIDDVITKDFLIECLNEGRMELDQALGAERWSYRTEFDYNAGQVVPGMNKLTLPTDMKESATFKNLLTLRIGRDKLPLTKVDKQALNRWYQGVARTILGASITYRTLTIINNSSFANDTVFDGVSYTMPAGTTKIWDNSAPGVKIFQYDSLLGFPVPGSYDTTINYIGTIIDDEDFPGAVVYSSGPDTADTPLTVTSSGDFDDSGTVVISGTLITDTLDTISYTTNNLSTILSGITDLSSSHTAGDIVWQGATFGRPMEYTVDNGEIIFSQPFGDDEAGENIVIDYYKELETVDSDADLLDEPGYRMYVPYLRYRMKEKRDIGLKREECNEYKSWKEKRDAAVAKEYVGQDIRLNIDLPC